MVSISPPPSSFVGTGPHSRFIQYKPRRSKKNKKLTWLRKEAEQTTDARKSRRQLDGVKSALDNSTSSSARSEQDDTVQPLASLESRCTRFKLVPRNGSSDPFSGLPFMVTAEVHEVIVFWTNPKLWNCIHNYSPGKSTKSYFFLEMEQDVLKLQTELDAVMFLYQAAALMAAVHPNQVLERRKLRLKRQALSVLRESIELIEDKPSQESFINALICATIAALCESQADQVQMHGNQIQGLIRTLEQMDDNDGLKTLATRMGRVFFFDNVMALKEGRSVICNENYLPGYMRAIVEAQDPQMFNFRDQSEHHSPIGKPFSQALIDVFHLWRTVMTIYVNPATESSHLEPMSTFFLTLGLTHRFYGSILQIIRQDVSHSRTPSKDPYGIQVRNTEVILAAALLMQWSILQHIIQPLGDICLSNGTIYLLRDLLHPTIANNRQSRVLQEAQLWALYASACWEITYLHNAPKGRWKPYFVQALRKKAVAMGIETWAQGSVLFERYWPTRLMAPDGAEWFNGLLLEGEVDPRIRGAQGQCCWQPACALRPRERTAE